MLLKLIKTFIKYRQGIIETASMLRKEYQKTLLIKAMLNKKVENQ